VEEVIHNESVSIEYFMYAVDILVIEYRERRMKYLLKLHVRKRVTRAARVRVQKVLRNPSYSQT
jgi:hypothetical protein